MIWFSSDLHLGHANILNYCKRPFVSVDEMNDTLINNWNAIVEPDDEVWVLGDFAMGKIAETLPLVSQLSGRKFLLCGNHDRPFRGNGRKAEGWTAKYLQAGFDLVFHGDIEMTIAGESVKLCHFPYAGDHTEEERFPGFRPVDDGQWLLHGHVHDQWSRRGKMINVGVDMRYYFPVSIDTIATLIRQGPGLY